MTKLALILGIALTTMPLLAGNVRAEEPTCTDLTCTVTEAASPRVIHYHIIEEAICPFDLCDAPAIGGSSAFQYRIYIYIHIHVGDDPCITDDICVSPDDPCEEGHRSNPPVPTRGEIGYPDPPGWYIVCL